MGKLIPMAKSKHWYCADLPRKQIGSYACGAYTEVFRSRGQGSGVIEQPPTPKKHGGTVLPKGGGVLENPSTIKERTARRVTIIHQPLLHVQIKDLYHLTAH